MIAIWVPSAGPLTSRLIASSPPAPGRFSTITWAFSSSPSGSATIRAAVSKPPPGLNGTTRMIVSPSSAAQPPPPPVAAGLPMVHPVTHASEATAAASDRWDAVVRAMIEPLLDWSGEADEALRHGHVDEPAERGEQHQHEHGRVHGREQPAPPTAEPQVREGEDAA